MSRLKTAGRRKTHRELDGRPGREWLGHTREDTTPDSVDELYKAPLAEFTERRNALAKQLREEGKRDAAAEVSKLKRPTVAVWAINQLAGAEPTLVGELLEVRRALAKTRDAAKLQELSRRRRQLVGALSKKAGAILRGAGHGATDQTLKRVGSTLLAVSTSEEERLLRRGRLQAELSAGGFEEVFGGLAVAEETGEGPSPAEERSREKADSLSEEARASKHEADELAHEAAALRRQLESAENRVREAKRRADDLAKKAKAAATKARRR
ncbi:MAG: hypothetical protein ABR505_11500 [Actinomycetota bacterium]